MSCPCLSSSRGQLCREGHCSSAFPPCLCLNLSLGKTLELVPPGGPPPPSLHHFVWNSGLTGFCRRRLPASSLARILVSGLWAVSRVVRDLPASSVLQKRLHLPAGLCVGRHSWKARSCEGKEGFCTPHPSRFSKGLGGGSVWASSPASFFHFIRRGLLLSKLKVLLFSDGENPWGRAQSHTSVILGKTWASVVRQGSQPHRTAVRDMGDARGVDILMFH